MTALLRDLSWPGVPVTPLVLVPVGSFEQHGPHLPMDTDTVIASAVAERVGRQLGAVVAPAVAYGASGEHQGFPGTISIGSEALLHTLVELTRSLSTWAGRVVFVNGHGGNLAALTGAVTQLRAEQHDVAWVPCATRGDAHAGYAETSLMLALAAGSVDMTAAVAGNTTPIAELLPGLVAHGVRAVSPCGVLGDPTAATAEAGAAILAEMVADVVCRIPAGVAR